MRSRLPTARRLPAGRGSAGRTRQTSGPDASPPPGGTTRLALRLTRLALEVDQVALELAAAEDLDTETLVPGAMLLLSGAVNQLERRLTVGEFLSPSRLAEWLAATRKVAGPASEVKTR